MSIAILLPASGFRLPASGFILYAFLGEIKLSFRIVFTAPHKNSAAPRLCETPLKLISVEKIRLPKNTNWNLGE